MTRNRLFLASLLLLAAVHTASGQSPVRQDSTGNSKSNWRGTWSARASTGLTLIGAWTAIHDSANGTVTGTWALVDSAGTQVASGAWSAAKAPTQWTGGWRAVIAGRSGEYAGTWTSTAAIKADRSFADLFEHAVQNVGSGTWLAGGRSGAWSIRAAKGGS